jgi:DNA transformation protein
VFFGILHQGRLFPHTDETSRAQYRALGMGPFRPNARQTLASYYEVPPEVLEDGERLRDWMRTALAARTRRPSRRRATGRPRARRP